MELRTSNLELGGGSRSALIVGAGIGGLAAAVALGRAGWRVRVFERAATPRELGFALGLAPNAMAALRELGLADAIRAEGVVAVSGEVRRLDGRTLRRFAAPSWRTSRELMVLALRPALHGALLTAVGPDALVLDSEAIQFETRGAGVLLELAGGRTAIGDVLIGADGVSSVIRKQLHPHEPPLRPSGHCAVRGVAHDVGHHLGDLSGVGYFGDGIEASTVRASKTAVYWYVSLLANDVAASEQNPQSVLERHVPIVDERFRAITGATRPEDMRFDELFDREPIEPWGSGAVTLVGDAAHPMLPHAGQGAAQALEDAVALGLVLAEADERTVPAALRTYERVRSRRTRRIVMLGRRIARVTTTRSRSIRFLRDTAIRIVPKTALLASVILGRHRDPHRGLR